MSNEWESWDTSSNVCIVGAGVSGLVAARALARNGRRVQIIDKGNGLGGRLATRRMGKARLDHGAQFFTVRGDDFRATIDDAINDGVVDVWCNGFDGEDGYPRYYCPGGMTSLAKWLAFQVEEAGGRILLGNRVSQIARGTVGWRMPLESGPEYTATHVIVTSPVPQTLELLDTGGIDLDPSIRTQLEAISYLPTIGVLATLDGPPDIGAPGGIQQSQDDVFSFIADNQQKGTSTEPAVTFHANGTLSSERWDDDSADVLADLLVEAQPFLGSAKVVEAQLKKWLYATPVAPHPERYVIASKAHPGYLILAGDAFGGPKVEGAFDSGLAAAAVFS